MDARRQASRLSNSEMTSNGAAARRIPVIIRWAMGLMTVRPAFIEGERSSSTRLFGSVNHITDRSRLQLTTQAVRECRSRQMHVFRSTACLPDRAAENARQWVRKCAQNEKEDADFRIHK